ILVTTQRAVQERSPAIDRLDELQLQLRVGSQMRPADIVERLEKMGFERVSTVEEVGQFASRGGILDVFGFGTPEPVRVEFWGDEIESLRRSNALTPRCTGTLDELRVLPADVSSAPPAASLNAGAASQSRRSLRSRRPAEAVLVR